MSLAVTHTQGSLAASCSTSQLAAWKGSLTKAKSSGRSADSPAVWQRQYRHWLICSSKCHSRHPAACALGAFLLRRSKLRHCQVGGVWVGTGAKCRGAPGQISAQAQTRQETVACKALAVAPSQHQYDLDTESTSNAVELHEASVRVGGELLLDSVGLKVPHGSRAVIVGPNGSGKTTLLSVIAGLVSLAEGQRLVGARSLGWLRQEAISGSSRTVLEEAEAASQAAAQKAALAAAEANLMQDPENTKLLEAYDAALLAAESSSGSTTVIDVLEGLGFTESDFNRPCSELSGGWQMRVALARALLSEPELLLLDEPTNHMDSNAKRWLTSYLANSLPSSTTLLLVTHDRFLLEDFRCSLVVEIHEKILSTFRCQSIGEWEQRRIKQVLDIEKEVKKLVTKIETDKEWIQRNKAKASTARQAQSRMKKVDKMEEELWAMKEQLRGLPSSRDLDAKAAAAESLEAEGTLPLSSMNRVVLKLPDAPLMHDSPVDNVLLSLSNATIGYNPDEPVLQKITMALGKGDRVVLLGPNGCGKSTLLRTLAGALDPIAGTRKVGVGGLRRARVQLFTQDLAQDLPGEMTPIDYVAKDAPAMLGVEGIRRALGALGLRSQVHMSPISTLSGGEKARVAMAKFTTRPSDVLLLDEPTNHLDGPAVVALSEGLQEHVSGAIVVATHDRAFIEALQANQTATVYPASRGKPGSIRIKRGKVALEAVGGAPPNLQRGACGHTSASEAPKDEKIEAPRTQVITRKQVQKEERRHERKISRHMDKIEKAEAALEKLTEKLGGATETDPAAVKEYQALTQKVEKLYEVLYSIDAGRK